MANQYDKKKRKSVFKSAHNTNKVLTYNSPTIPIPANPPTNANVTLNQIWEKQIDLSLKSQPGRNKYSVSFLFSVGAMHGCNTIKVEAAPTYKQITNTNNGIELLKLIKDIAVDFSSQK